MVCQLTYEMYVRQTLNSHIYSKGREKTAFLLAAQKGHIKILQALKELGQNFDETTIDSKYSALHLVSRTVRLQIACTKYGKGGRQRLPARDCPIPSGEWHKEGFED